MDKPSNLVIFGEPDEKTVAQINRCLLESPALKGVLCGDAHYGYAQPVGGVTAYIDNISVSGVGFDIACGNLAIKTDAKWADIRSKHKLVADAISQRISFGVGRKNYTPIDHPLFSDDAWNIPLLKKFKKKAEDQLGSCGSGNHYVDVFIDEQETVWVGVHFGSRGLGHTIASNTLLVAGAKDGMDVAPCVLHVRSSLGAEYLESMRLAGLYAYAGREYVARYVVQKILKANIIEEVHNHHNFAWKENHDGQDYWVVRKGATPAFPGQRGFVGGSMGDISVIIRGVDSPKSKEALYSTVHGAGRLMSRTEAAGKVKWIFDKVRQKKIPTRVSEGKVNETSMRQKMVNNGIELRGAGADEAPEVYRPLQNVLDFHAGTIEIETILRPKIVVMAGADTYDPYKD
jgi:tRNA-splicing ligase RtcB